MDDPFGTGVWGDEPPKTISPPSTTILPPFNDDDGGFGQPSGDITLSSNGNDDNEDFDDFGDEFAAAPSTTAFDITDQSAEDDDFGDFGDFDAAPPDSFPETEHTTPNVAPIGEWQALQVHPWPSTEEVISQVHAIIDPLFLPLADSTLPDTPLRQAEGIAQILYTPESRALYTKFITLPENISPPPIWKRSRIRRQHLIELGIPVNLDEVLPTAQAKAMPAINITTRPMSAPPVPRSGAEPKNSTSGRSRAGTPRAGTPRSGLRNGDAGGAPRLNHGKIDELLALNPDALTLVPIPKLEAYLNDLRAQTAESSGALTYLLQARDMLQQDSDMFNKLIGDLVVEAQKRATGGKGGRSTPARQGTR